MCVFLLEWINKSVVEILHFVVPPLDGSFPASRKMSEFVQILSDLETFDSSTVRTIVIRDALIRPSLSTDLQFIVPNLQLMQSEFQAWNSVRISMFLICVIHVKMMELLYFYWLSHNKIHNSKVLIHIKVFILVILHRNKELH